MNNDTGAVTARALLRDAVARLEEADVTSAARNAEWMLCDALDESRTGLFMRLDEPVPPASARRFAAMLARRLEHEPLQYILGYTEFFGLRLKVGPDVLIPRPETEQVVETGLLLIRDRTQPRVLDVGTGSGCIPIAVKSRRSDAHVWACDVSAGALAIAEANASAHAVDVRFFQADALAEAFVEKAPSGLDLLISNPPYVPEEEISSLPKEVAAYEPRLALLSRGDPITFYRRLGAASLRLLRPGGYVVFETHAESGLAASRALEEMGYSDVVLSSDYSGRPRILRATRPISGD